MRRGRSCDAPASTCSRYCSATAGSSAAAPPTRKHLPPSLRRHGPVSRGRAPWTRAHARWVGGQGFDHPAQQLVLAEYRQAVEDAGTRLERLTRQVAEAVAAWSMAPVVAAYQALRGVAFLT